jgi:hypothetical protein
LPIDFDQKSKSEIGKSKIGNPITHPLPRGGTDLIASEPAAGNSVLD